MQTRFAAMFALVLAGSLAASCKSNQSGMIAARLTGDVSATPLRRIALGDSGPCGATTLTPAGETIINRRPYLQRVTASSGMVVWTATATAGATVSITTPDGTVVTRAEAGVDATAPLAAGRAQWVATLAGLSPATRYCYEIQSNGQTLIQGGTFVTAPLAGSGAPVSVVVFGDSGEGGSDQHALLRQMRTLRHDLMLHTGDIAYDHGTLADFESKFFSVYAPLLSGAAMFPTSGNHDYETADAAAYRQVFALPENGGADGLERWYSFDWGDVHFVALDTERIGDAQARWLAADLAANQLRWTVVYGHRPPHSTGEHGDTVLFKQYFVPILEEHHVDLVLAGHDHHYERFLPQHGITYVVTGGGGRGTRDVYGGPLTAFAESVIHCIVVEIAGDKLSLHAIDGSGREFDSTVIAKAAPPPP